MRKLFVIVSCSIIGLSISSAAWGASAHPVVKKKIIAPKTWVAKKGAFKKVFPPKKVIPVSTKPCEVGGCSGTICGEPGSNKLVSTCEYKPEYPCYKLALCTRERLEGRDRCVWQFNEAFNACIEGLKPNKKSLDIAPGALKASLQIPKNLRVTISGFAFNPETIEIHKGETVTFTNEDTAAHTVTEKSGLFDSGSLAQGKKYERKFTEEGVFEYSCKLHPSMHGKVIVK